MSRTGKRRTRAIVAAVVLVLVGGFLGVRGVGAWQRAAVEDAVREAATAYVDLVATGDEDDLERLWSLSVSEDPAALRTAGDLLVAADERIEVLGVGDPQEVDAPPGSLAFDAFRSVDVSYRLDGLDHDHAVVLGRLEGRSGRDAADWRVTAGLTGALGWSTWNPRATTLDLYVNGALHAGDPVELNSGEMPDQPLYPAVYRVEVRNDPWYASEGQDVPVTAGGSTPLGLLVAEATDATRREALELLAAAFDTCGTGRSWSRCPAFDLADDWGAEVFRRGWWRGLAKQPTIEFRGTGFTLAGGVLRIVTPDGVRRVRFGGTGTAPVDLRSGRVFLSGLTLEEEW